MVDICRSGEHAAAEKPDRLRPRLLPQVSRQWRDQPCPSSAISAGQSLPDSQRTLAAGTPGTTNHFTARAVRPSRSAPSNPRESCFSPSDLPVGSRPLALGTKLQIAKSARGRSSTVVLPRQHQRTAMPKTLPQPICLLSGDTRGVTVRHSFGTLDPC